VSKESGKPLRFGIMVPKDALCAWEAEVVRRLLQEHLAVLSLVVVDESPSQPKSWRNRLRHALWNFYNRVAVRGRVPAADRVPWAPLVGDARVVFTAPEVRNTFSQYFSQEAVDAVHASNLDFMLRFGFNIIRGEILSTPRYGVWSFHHGDLFAIRGQPACFWEIHDGHDVTGITLQRLTDKLDSGIVLRTRFIRTIAKSYPRARDAVLRAGLDMPVEVCREILNGRLEQVQGSPARTVAPVRRTPTNLQVVWFLTRQFAAMVKGTLGSLLAHDQWNVGVVRAPIESILNEGLTDPRWFPAPRRGVFLADPFGAVVNGRLVVLAESLADRDNRGRLAAFEWTETGARALGEPIKSPSHLAYPFLFEYRGRVLCVTESVETNEVTLFQCEGDPLAWRRISTMLSGIQLIDPTIFQHDNRWWLFGVLRRNPECDELHAWFAESPEGPWTRHRGNPLKADVRSTRPGGTPFVADGFLWRPSQDCSRVYGGRLVLNRIDVLTPERFAETPANILEPRRHWPYRAGMHTISRLGPEMYLIDAKRLIFSPHVFFRQVGLIFRRRALRAGRQHNDHGNGPGVDTVHDPSRLP
jgi:methionyl-tRNA formyltransferase